MPAQGEAGRDQRGHDGGEQEASGCAAAAAGPAGEPGMRRLHVLVRGRPPDVGQHQHWRLHLHALRRHPPRPGHARLQGVLPLVKNFTRWQQPPHAWQCIGLGAARADVLLFDSVHAAACMLMGMDLQFGMPICASWNRAAACQTGMQIPCQTLAEPRFPLQRMCHACQHALAAHVDPMFEQLPY